MSQPLERAYYELTFLSFPDDRILFVVVTLLVYVLSKIGASVFAGAVLIEVVTGINFWFSVPTVIAATAVYTISGGLRVGFHHDIKLTQNSKF